MKEIKNLKRGISLIVLVITIIVIIILAVAVILSIANNNPIENAKKAVKSNNDAVNLEAINLAALDWRMAEDTGNSTGMTLYDYLQEKLKGIVDEETLKKVAVVDDTPILLNEKIKEDDGTVNIDLEQGVNAPRYNKESMIPVCFDSSGNVYKADVTNKNENYNWYSYTETDKKWANVVTVSSTKRQEYINADVGTPISYDDINGMFVWIPRYAYSIGGGIYKTAGKTSSGNIDVKFLMGTTDTDYNATKYERDYDETVLSAGATTPMIVHPVFTSDTAMGGWDKELPGIWVAKYESSSSNPSASNGGGNVTNLDVIIKPTIASWRNISVNNIFTVCRNMEKSNNIYGLVSSDEPHMLKNSEWGAIAYLCASKYGNVPSINSNSSYKPKEGGTSSSTTNNEYGIYDLNGGAWEYVAAYYDNGSIISNGTSLINAALKYKNVYSVSDEEKNNTIADTVTNNGTKLTRDQLWSKDNSYNVIRRRLATANYNLLSSKKGDATYECIQTDKYSYIGMNASNANDTWLNIANNSTTASYVSNWDSDNVNIGFCSRPFVSRGGYHSFWGGAGVFSLGSHYGSAAAGNGFRVCLVPSSL